MSYADATAMSARHEQVLLNAFEAARDQLRAIAFRMLGSLNEVDDALQEAWLRASRSELQAVRDLPAWLTTIVSRVCLDMLRARRRRAEAALDVIPRAATVARDPEDELSRVEAVGSALLVVLDALGPAERIAFVLHDMLGLPFEQIAQVVERTPVTAKKLASRARARVVGRAHVAPDLLANHRSVVAAFLTATRERDVDGMVAVLAADVVRRTKHRGQSTSEVRGARAAAREALSNTRSARMAELVLLDGLPGLIVAPRGRLAVALRFAIERDRIAVMEVITDASELRKLQVRLFELPERCLHRRW